jgi:hypothetical protein
MSRQLTFTERTVLFTAWPFIAPVIAVLVAIILVIAWPYILFGRDVRIG